MKVYRATCDCGFDRTYRRRGAADRYLEAHRCADYWAVHRRRCRSCGWSGAYKTARRADYAKRRHSCRRHLAAAAAKARRLARLAAVDRTPKRCRHKQANHVHGTHAAYVLDRCRCPRCTKANADYEANRTRQQAYGRWNGLVDAEPARSHVRQLLEQGMGLKRIAEVSGVPHGGLSKLIYGKRLADGTRVPSKRIRPATERRLLATRPNLASGARIDAIGTHRRAQALVAIGYSQQAIADRLGITRANFGRMMRAATVQRRTRDAMAALYDEWSMRLPPATIHRERISVARSRNHARKHGWLPPLAWDDDAVDDPAAHPCTLVDVDLESDRVDEAAILRRMHGDRSIRVNTAEAAEVIRRLRAKGVSDNQITTRTGLRTTRYASQRRDLLASLHRLPTGPNRALPAAAPRERAS